MWGTGSVFVSAFVALALAPCGGVRGSRLPSSLRDHETTLYDREAREEFSKCFFLW